MAENTFKKTPKGNTKKQKGQKEEKGLRFSFDFLKDRRFHLAMGFFVMILAVFLTISFLSYLFTGSEDQSLVESIGTSTVAENGKEVQNWLGITGAYLSHLFIYKWFGLAAFLFIPIIFYGGYKVVFGKALFKLGLVLRSSIFFLFWSSLALGYIVLKLDDVNSLGFLCGGIGYELAAFSDSILGWGTPLLLGFLFVVFAIYFFNITSLHLKAPDADIEEKEKEEEKEEEKEGIKEKSKKEPLVIVEDKVEEEIAEEEKEPEEETEEEVEEEETEEEEAEEEEEEEEIEEEPYLKTEEPVANTLLTDNEIGVTIEQSKGDEVVNEKIENYDPTLDLASYKYPPLELMNEYETSQVTVTQDELKANIDRIVETLSHYNISIASIKATIGPTVTLYEIVPEAGVRISKIKNLEDDIALSLSALGIRIIAPIPGKGTIGIEVPNKNKEMVSLRSVLSTEKFTKSDMDLPVAFGKTISNEVFIKDLTKMPHLLIAGATGQGKSVGLNVLLTSLLYKKHPSQLKFVLVDPKKVELSIYRTIERHFLAKLPNTEEAIITDTKKVVYTLNSLCIEMDSRYELLKDAGCRNLKEYNTKFVQRKLNPNNGHRFMPYIVLVIDELADLMMTAGKEVETPIARLAQLARAIGIHLVVATQRPSVNVITGIIKANFPARLSFKVTSKVDSRTILDQGGADQLIGQGDMLFSNGSDLTRIQCAFVDTPEIDTVCEYIGNQRGYESAYLLPEYQDDDEGSGSKEFDPSELDPMFEEAARMVVSHQQGSTSLIQRRLKLGYNRAGRIVDQLEAAGIVGPFEGSKAREVLIKDEMSLQELLSTLRK